MHINIISKERLGFETAKAISAVLEKEQDKDILLLLAGGSAFAVYDAISPQWLSDHLTIAVTDDRFSHEMDVNNSHILQSTAFYNECINADAYYISSEVWDEQNPQELAKRFEHGLRKWREEFPKGVVIAVFGMGEDGHTCGMIPDTDKKFAELFIDTDKWVAGYSTQNNEHHERISITMPFIKQNVDHAIVYFSGEKKKLAFNKLLAEKGSLSETPARIFRELKNVEIFTDMAEK
jgi:6-phosphogluconolactonase/glucosamine-6-phosphate isomerase/deaminase